MPRRGGSAAYDKAVPKGSERRKMEDRIKFHANRAETLFGDDKVVAPRVASVLHKTQAKRIAKQVNEKYGPK